MSTDFDEDERAFLCTAHAEEALRRAGVLLEDLRPRALESFDAGPTRELSAAAHEKRRQYQWRLDRRHVGYDGPPSGPD